MRAFNAHLRRRGLIGFTVMAVTLSATVQQAAAILVSRSDRADDYLRKPENNLCAAIIGPCGSRNRIQFQTTCCQPCRRCWHYANHASHRFRPL